MSKIKLNKVILNLGFVGFADLFGRVIGFFVVIFLARYLGPEGYGKYCLILSFSYIFLVLANFGIDPLTTKDVSKDRSLSQLYSTLHFVIKLPLSFISIIILNLSALALALPKDILLCMAIFSIHIVFNTLSDAICTIFNAHERMEYSSIVKILNSLTGFIFTVVLILLKASLLNIIISRVAVFFISFLVALFFLLKKFPRPHFALINYARIKYMLYSAFPFLTIGIASILYFKVDIIMLSKLKGELYVGWYAPAANDLFFAIFIIPKTVTTVLFPRFSRTFKESSESFTRNVNFALKAMIVLGMPIFVGTIILAPKIIDITFGNGFENSVVILQIISIAILLGFARDILGYALTAAEKIRTIMWINICSLGLNFVLNLFLIPLYAHIGAAISSVICFFVSLCCTFIFLKRIVGGIQIFPYLLKPLFATVGMGISLYFLYDLNLFLLVGVGSLIYFLVLTIQRGFDRDELLLLRNAIVRTQ